MVKRDRVDTRVRVWNSDAYDDIREFCTCPGCRVVWSHRETGDIRADELWAIEHYGKAVTCPECGLTTKPIEGQTFRQRLRSEWRQIVPPNEPKPLKEVDR